MIAEAQATGRRGRRADVARIFDPALFPQLLALIEARLTPSGDETSSSPSAWREAIAA
jgi:hypothetical protein